MLKNLSPNFMVLAEILVKYQRNQGNKIDFLMLTFIKVLTNKTKALNPIKTKSNTISMPM